MLGVVEVQRCGLACLRFPHVCVWPGARSIMLGDILSSREGPLLVVGYVLRLGL